MARFSKRKRLIFFTVLALAAVAAFGAYAYFTSSGSGLGDARVGTTKPFGLGGQAAGPVYPGSSSDVSLWAINPGDGSQRIGTITLTGVITCPDGYLGDPDHPGVCYSLDPYKIPNSVPEITTCESFSGGATNDASKNFWMAPVAVNQDVPPTPETQAPPPFSQKGTLVMNNLNSSQDSCKGAQLLLLFASN